MIYNPKIHYYYKDPDTDNIVFTELYLIEQEQCCGLGCRHCPYEPKDTFGNDIINEKFKYLKDGEYNRENK